jgi:ADP-ribosylglycohydrolase
MYLNREDYYNKVYGCWMGKNCGGTLGAPLEDYFGRDEMFDVWWYPKIEEGGIPNDDLEIQLIWLQMLEDRGLGITARDFADYWLDCLLYNPDEYGLHKTNLRKGLLPPMSGWYNNWHKDCMGSPIRSEIWACIAPGRPNIAAAYAYEDAILDHAGGESVYGEMFNAALQSAAFVESDRDTLLAIGLSYMPENCLTAKAVRNAMDAHRRGLDWKEAREFVLRESYHTCSQHSPVNLGFQTIGWLYGEDFGDGICKAVNCGWDTDCTGATLGAIYGILMGKDGLPEKWTAPLSDTIATSLESGGMAHVRVPENLEALTRQVMALGEKLMTLHEADGPDLPPSADTKALWRKSPTAVPFDLKSVTVTTDQPGGPAIAPNEEKAVVVSVRNNRLTPQVVRAELLLPEGWDVFGPGEGQEIAPGEETRWNFRVRVDDPAKIETTNRASVRLLWTGQPKVEDVPVVFIGANRWLATPRMDGTLDTPTAIEEDTSPDGVGSGWTEFTTSENALPLEEMFAERDGILYLRHYVRTEEARRVWVELKGTPPFKAWLNGEPVHETRESGRFRPSIWPDGRSGFLADLNAGWNQLLFKVERRAEPALAHFLLGADAPHRPGLYDVTECRFPWEE